MTKLSSFLFIAGILGIFGCASMGRDYASRSISSDDVNRQSVQRDVGHYLYPDLFCGESSQRRRDYSSVDLSYDRSRLLFFGFDAVSKKEGLISTSIADGTSKILISSPDPRPDQGCIMHPVYFKAARAANRVAAIIEEYDPSSDWIQMMSKLVVYSTDGTSTPEIVEVTDNKDIEATIDNLMISDDGNFLFYTLHQHFKRRDKSTASIKIRDLRQKKSVIILDDPFGYGDAFRYETIVPLALTNHFVLFALTDSKGGYRFLEYSRATKRLRTVLESGILKAVDKYEFKKGVPILGALSDGSGFLLSVDGESVQKVLLPKPASLENVIFELPFVSSDYRWFTPIVDGDRYFVTGVKSIGGQKISVLAAVEIATGKTQLIYEGARPEEWPSQPWPRESRIEHFSFKLMPGSSTVIVVQERKFGFDTEHTIYNSDEIWKISTVNAHSPKKLWPPQDPSAAPSYSFDRNFQVDQGKTLWSNIASNSNSSELLSLDVTAENPIPNLYAITAGVEPFEMPDPDQLMLRTRTGYRVVRVGRTSGKFQWLADFSGYPMFAVNAVPRGTGHGVLIFSKTTPTGTDTTSLVLTSY